MFSSYHCAERKEKSRLSNWTRETLNFDSEGPEMKILRRSKRRHNAYCAFCRTPRRVSRKRNISFGNILAAALTSPVIMWLMWGAPDARVFIVFACLLGVAEFFVQLRWRMSIICRACGFDPVLYVKSPRQAAKLVKDHLDRRRNSAEAILARPLNLPVLTPERAKSLAMVEEAQSGKTGQLVSRDV
jgi:hypothetical protein